jgi:IclR family pca regulon transcriptional regulator
MGHVLLGSLSDEKLDRYLASVSFQMLTPFTSVDAPELRQAIKQARTDGFAIVSQQLEIALHSIGVPVRNRRNEVIAGLSVSMRDTSLNLASLARELLPRLQSAAENITQGLPS